jgi:hypothetical protein
LTASSSPGESWRRTTTDVVLIQRTVARVGGPVAGILPA